MERVRLLEPIKLIRKRRLAKQLGVSPWTIDRWRRAGSFPQPIKLNGNVLAWRRTEVDDWLAARETASA